MSEIKIVKNGLDDYRVCVKKVEDKFIELNNIEISLRNRLAEKDWQGMTRDKCEIILTLTSEYKKKIKEILDEMNQQEQELKQNVTTFAWKSSVVRSL